MYRKINRHYIYQSNFLTNINANFGAYIIIISKNIKISYQKSKLKYVKSNFFMPQSMTNGQLK